MAIRDDSSFALLVINLIGRYSSAVKAQDNRMKFLLIFGRCRFFLLFIALSLSTVNAFFLFSGLTTVTQGLIFQFLAFSVTLNAYFLVVFLRGQLEGGGFVATLAEGRKMDSGASQEDDSLGGLRREIREWSNKYKKLETCYSEDLQRWSEDACAYDNTILLYWAQRIEAQLREDIGSLKGLRSDENRVVNIGQQRQALKLEGILTQVESLRDECELSGVTSIGQHLGRNVMSIGESSALALQFFRTMFVKNRILMSVIAYGDDEHHFYKNQMSDLCSISTNLSPGVSQDTRLFNDTNLYLRITAYLMAFCAENDTKLRAKLNYSRINKDTLEFSMECTFIENTFNFDARLFQAYSEYRRDMGRGNIHPGIDALLNAALRTASEYSIKLAAGKTQNSFTLYRKVNTCHSEEHQQRYQELREMYSAAGVFYVSLSGDCDPATSTALKDVCRNKAKVFDVVQLKDLERAIISKSELIIFDGEIDAWDVTRLYETFNRTTDFDRIRFAVLGDAPKATAARIIKISNLHEVGGLLN